MTKNIAISDEVYEQLKREKGDRSFSEVIEERLRAGARIGDVTGHQILDEETTAAVAQDIRDLSRGTLDRFIDEPHLYQCSDRH